MRADPEPEPDFAELTLVLYRGSLELSIKINCATIDRDRLLIRARGSN